MNGDTMEGATPKEQTQVDIQMDALYKSTVYVNATVSLIEERVDALENTLKRVLTQPLTGAIIAQSSELKKLDPIVPLAESMRGIAFDNGSNGDRLKAANDKLISIMDRLQV